MFKIGLAMIGILQSALLFVLILGSLVLLHELGHYVTARYFGVRVLEFGIGFPPRLFKKVHGDTTYSLNLIPLGGFVRLLGEEDPSAPMSLASKSLWERFAVLIAGPAMNLLVAITLLSIVYAVPHDTVSAKVVVESIVPGGVAEVAGLEEGDQILALGDHEISHSQDLIYQVHKALGKTESWKIGRSTEYGFEEMYLPITPRKNWPAGEGPTGIIVANTDQKIVRKSYSLGRSILKALSQIRDMTVMIQRGMTGFVFGNSSEQAEFAGPIGIAQMAGEVSKIGVMPLVAFVASLSLSLAVINLLPIPGLDGGRLFFIALEFVRGGRRVSPSQEAFVHLLGITALIALFLIVSYHDILRVMDGRSFLQ
jgi:regulator of sigma E protease